MTDADAATGTAPHHITVGDGSRGGVALWVDGRGAGDPPLVLVHGFTGSTADWAGVAPSLARRRRVVAYDHRGHGRPRTSFRATRATSRPSCNWIRRLWRRWRGS